MMSECVDPRGCPEYDPAYRRSYCKGFDKYRNRQFNGHPRGKSVRLRCDCDTLKQETELSAPSVKTTLYARPFHSKLVY